MENTYKNFVELAKLHNGETDFNKLAEQYQETESPVILAYCFVSQYAFIISQVNKYFYLTDADKSSFAVEELHKAMKDYESDKGASVRTLFSRYLNRRLYAETKMLNHQKRSANNSAECYEDIVANNQLTNDVVEDEFTHEIELLDSIKSCSNFTDNEVRYCEILLKESGILKDSEIARMIGVSPSAIHQMKKSLKKKFMKNSLCF